MSKLVATLSFVAVLLLTGCFAPDSGSDDSAGDGASDSSQSGDAATGDNEVGTPGENEADENQADGNEGGKDDDKGDGDSADADEPPPPAGPCDAVVPYDEVEGLIPDPTAGSMTNGGDVISQCEWVSEDGHQSLVVSARDAALIGATGIEKPYRKKQIKNLGEEAGSRIKTGNASVQVYAMVKGSGKAQPVLYTVTWKGEDVEVAVLTKIAQRIV